MVVVTRLTSAERATADSSCHPGAAGADEADAAAAEAVGGRRGEPCAASWPSEVEAADMGDERCADAKAESDDEAAVSIGEELGGDADGDDDKELVVVLAVEPVLLPASRLDADDDEAESTSADDNELSDVSELDDDRPRTKEVADC